MSLTEKIVEAAKEARKARNADRLSVLQLVLAAIKNEQIGRNDILSDSEIEKIINRQVKQLDDALADFVRAGRTDLADKTKNEKLILAEFLPTALTEEELQQVIKNVLAGKHFGQADIGKAMGLAMAAVQGRADGTRVRAVVAALIG